MFDAGIDIRPRPTLLSFIRTVRMFASNRQTRSPRQSGNEGCEAAGHEIVRRPSPSWSGQRRGAGTSPHALGEALIVTPLSIHSERDPLCSAPAKSISPASPLGMRDLVLTPA